MSKKLITSFLNENKKQSEEYNSRKAILWRKKREAEHPTEIAVTECMDGRVHISRAAGLPAGTVFTFQSLGGAFDFGVSHFGLTLRQWIAQVNARKRDALILTSYHFSKGDSHRGCAGYKYDTEAAFAGTEKLCGTINKIFSKNKKTYAVVLGVETDEDAFTVYNKRESFAIADNLDISEKELFAKLRKLFPDMPLRIVRDLAFFLEGNIRHVKELRANPRPEEKMMHAERAIAVGRGLNWIDGYNEALVIGPWTHDLKKAVTVAAKIVLGNLEAGRISKDDGVLLIASAQATEKSIPDIAIAEEEALSLVERCKEFIAENVPDLIPYLDILPGRFDPEKRLFTPVK